MTDSRLPTRPIVIAGLDEETNESINSRFSALEQIAERVQDTTVIEPKHAPPRYPYDGQLELCDGTDWDGRGDGTRGVVYWDSGAWHPLLDEQHVTVTAPDYAEDPHEQYWHTTLDSAAAHMIFQDFANPKPVAEDAIITGYAADVHTPYHTTTDLAAGTITMPATTRGLYNIFVSVSMDGSSNSTYFIQAFKNGVATALALPIVLKGTVTVGSNSITGTVVLEPSEVLDLRVVGSGGAEIAMITFGMSRYLSTDELGAATIQDQLPTAPTLPGNWGQGGMP